MFTFILAIINAQVRDMSTACHSCLGMFLQAPVLVSFHLACLSLQAGKMKSILCSDWLPEVWFFFHHGKRLVLVFVKVFMVH